MKTEMTESEIVRTAARIYLTDMVAMAAIALYACFEVHVLAALAAPAAWVLCNWTFALVAHFTKRELFELASGIVSRGK